MRRVLIIADAACESGFAKCTHKMLIPELQKTWDVFVLGLNYRGDGHNYDGLHNRIFPAFAAGTDMFGVERLPEIYQKYQPQLIIIQNDPWNMPAYFEKMKQWDIEVPVIGAVAVDGLNCRGDLLNKFTRVVFWTEFAKREAIAGGMTVPSGVVPLGVDLDVYQPGEPVAARKQFEFPEDVVEGFIFGNINRNQPRKRFDLTCRYFGNWLKESGVKDAFLYVHSCPTGDHGHQVERLARYYGFNPPHKDSKLIIAEPEPYKGTPEKFVVKTIQTFNVGITTSTGEGWGLPAMEMMACGVPVIAGDWSAYGEWARDAAYLVPCTAVDTNRIGVIGGVPDERAFIEALDRMYRDPSLREKHRRAGWELVARSEYRWENIAKAFAAEVEMAVSCQAVPA